MSQAITMNSLSTRSLSAVFWGAGGAIVRLLLQFGSQVVLARILGPEQYGLFAIGAIVISFSNFFSDIGLAYGLIQKETVNQRDVRFVFTWQVILGTAVMLAIYFSSATIAEFFGEIRAFEVIQAMAIICLLNAMAAPSLNLLKRDLDFRRIQLAQIISFIVGYLVVGIPLALAGSQAWALVAAWAVQALLFLFLVYAATRHSVVPLVSYESARAVSGYGATVLITNLVNWLINNIDRVIIGRIFPSREIGLYATTYNMLYMPTSSLLGVIQPVFFSASARITDRQDAIKSSYRALIGAVAVFIVPAFICIGAVAETFVLALYGPKWSDAASLFRPLAFAMPLFLVGGFTTPLLWTGGHAGREFRAQLPLAILWAGACWFAAQHSVAAVAWTVFGLFWVRCLVIIISAARHLKLEIGPLWLAVRGGIAISVLLGPSIFLLDMLAKPIPALLRLVLDAAAGAAGLLLLLRWVPGVIGPELALLNQRILDRAPQSMAKHLDFLGQKKTVK
jgi:O-antigen/teichoic acid export membrane protein